MAVARYTTLDSRFEALSRLFEDGVSQHSLNRPRPTGLTDWLFGRLEEVFDISAFPIDKGETLVRIALLKNAETGFLSRYSDHEISIVF